MGKYGLKFKKWQIGLLYDGRNMLKLNLQIRNPFFKDSEFKNLWFRSGSFNLHKQWELQLMYYDWNIFELNVNISWKGEDHAGPKFDIGIFGYQFTASVYDSRHWNFENNTWEVYDREENESTES